MDTERRDAIPLPEDPSTRKDTGASATSPCIGSSSGKLQSGRLNTLTWGIFTVVYETSSPFPLEFRSFAKMNKDVIRDYCAVQRFFGEVLGLTPTALLLHLSATVWSALLPALALFSYGVLLQILMAGIARGETDTMSIKLILLTWVLSSVISVAFDWLLQDTATLIRSNLRIYFLPSLANTSLSLDLQTLQDPSVSSSFPREYLFEDTAPGWDVISEGCRFISIIVTFLSHIVVILSILPDDDDLRPGTCPLLLVAYFALRFLPSFVGAPQRAFIYYSDNFFYKRLNLLYRMAFAQDLREPLMCDGATRSIAYEYHRASQNLGPGRNDPSHLRFAIPRPWYTSVLRQVVLELPLISFFCLQIWKFTPASLISMFLVWQGQNSLRTIVHLGDVCLALRRTCSSATSFYATLDIRRASPAGNLPYPDVRSSSREGADVAFCNVSFSYPISSFYAISKDPKAALHGVTFNIHPGTLTLIIGKNGSGKSTLLKLLSGLYRPHTGDISLDKTPMHSFCEHDIHRAICHLPQEPQIYPLSLRDNLQIGLPHPADYASILYTAEQAGILDLVARLPDGFDTLMGSVATSYRGVTGSYVDGISESDLSPQLNEEYLKHFDVAPVLSRGEKQRLALARTFLKLEHSDIRLLLVDEPASALDPVAELDFCTKLGQCRRGRSVVIVTHRFAQLAKHADMILCMKDGIVAERGTHDELMALGGEYPDLYNAQQGNE